MDRDELIAALVIDKFSGFSKGDEAMLGGASDVRLEELRVAAENNRKTSEQIARLEAENRQGAARLKVAEERIVTLEQPMTEEDYLRHAPQSVRAILEARAAEEAAQKSSLVASLKDLGVETEAELQKKSIGELTKLAQFARLPIRDFSGRGMPTERNASQRVSYAPPDPYKEGLEKLRAAEAGRR